MSDPKLCKDCRHAKIGTFVSCKHPINMTADFVVGGMRSLHTPGFLRQTEGYCGEQAEWFEAREA